MKVLDRINKANDIHGIKEEDLEQLCQEIRDYLLETVSHNGGHLASNLGIVELTVALHRYLDFPRDKLIFDVGHQSYVHKILTGRREAMKTLRQLNGISGFPDRRESDCDTFISGHAGTSVSVALGFASARELNGTNEKIVAVLGDGSLTNGMIMEAFNNVSRIKSNIVLILNDNERSIARNTGGIANYLGKIRTGVKYANVKRSVQTAVRSIPVVGTKIQSGIHNAKDSIKRLIIPGMVFEDLGLTYIGPIDGHNIDQISYALENSRNYSHPVIIHVVTKKGKGYQPAMDHPALYHGVGKFDPVVGVVEKEGNSYTDVFSRAMLEMAEESDKVVAITAAMPYGTGLYDFKKKYPARFFDAGIAEEHAVTFAGGLAAAGMIPVVAIYSTFLQRAYDQIIHDVCMQNLHVVFAVDRAGIVGNDGKTHQGIFDEAYLSMIPNLTVMSPKNGWELREMLRYAVYRHKGPIAVRYPRENVPDGLDGYKQPVEYHNNEILERGSGIAILATGAMVRQALTVRDRLQERGIHPTVINLRFLDFIDMDTINGLKDSHRLFVTIEEVCSWGSYGQRLAAAIQEEKIRNELVRISLPDAFIPHGSISDLRKLYGLDADSVVEKILARYKNM